MADRSLPFRREPPPTLDERVAVLERDITHMRERHDGITDHVDELVSELRGLKASVSGLQQTMAASAAAAAEQEKVAERWRKLAFTVLGGVLLSVVSASGALLIRQAWIVQTARSIGSP